MSKLIIKQANQNYKPIDLIKGSTIKVRTIPNAKYEFLDKNKSLKNPKKLKVEDDLWLFEEGNLSGIPDVIVENYYHDVAGALLSNSSDMLMQTIPSAQMPASTVVQKGFTLSSATGLLLAGTAVAHVAKKDDDSRTNVDTTNTISPTNPPITTPTTPPVTTPTNPPVNPPVTPTPVTAKVTINPIDNVNQETTNKTIEITGGLEVSDNATSYQVTVIINNEVYTAKVTDKTWSVSITGDKLAFAQGEQTIIATITATAGTQNVTNNAQKTYVVDTQIDEPVIHFDMITEDNKIDFDESNHDKQVISGTVSNANEGDIVELTVGNRVFEGKVTAGKFVVEVPTAELVANQQISAVVTTQDTAGNIAKGTNTHTYTVDVTPPVTPPVSPLNVTVTIDDIATINSKKVAEELILTGEITLSDKNADVKVVVMVDNQEYTAQVDADKETWSLLIDGAKLATKEGENSARAVVTASLNGNTKTNTASLLYLVDTQIDKPIITLDAIAQDDIINLVESQAPKTTISGNVTNAKAGDEVLLEIGNAKSQVAIGQDGRFSIEVDTLTLLNHATITASITTSDEAGNTATSDLVTKNYTVATQAPKAVDITINNITEDNTVNKVESEGTKNITISGKAEVADNTKVLILCQCNTCTGAKWKQFETIVKNGTFEIMVDGKDVADGNIVKASITQTDNAGNTTTSEASKDYETDLINPEQKLTLNVIADNNVLDLAEYKAGRVSITGTLDNVGADETVSKLVLIINGKEHNVTLTGKDYHADIAVADLAQADKVVASATVIDKAGNTTTVTAVQNYTLEIEPKASIVFENITNDNLIDGNEKNSNVDIKGTVSGDFNDGDTVKIVIGNATHTTVVNAEGKFTLNVPAQALIDNGSLQLNATLMTNNVLQQPVEIALGSKAYGVNISNTPMTISINDITTDNLINQTEAKGEVEVSGKVTGASGVQTVSLAVGAETIQVQTDASGVFKTNILASKLLNVENYTITAKVEGQEVSTSKKYAVNADSVAKIDITGVDKDFAIDGKEMNGLVRIEGEATFAGDHASGRVNPQLVRQVAVKIGGTTYTVGVEKGKFQLDIPIEELKNLNGQEISYSFKAEPWYQATDNYGNTGYLPYNSNLPVRASNVTLTSPFVTQGTNGYVINASETVTVVSGKVEGSAKVDDNITVMVGGQNYQTKVLEGNTFSVAVRTNDLVTAKGVVTAKLDTTNLAKENISVTDHEQFAIFDSAKQSAGFVSYHQGATREYIQNYFDRGDTDKLPYFIKGLGFVTDHPLSFETGVNNDPDAVPIFGGKLFGRAVGVHDTPLVVKYYFVKPTDINYLRRSEHFGEEMANFEGQAVFNRATNHPNDIKGFIRRAYQEISNYTNIVFEETTNIDEADSYHFHAPTQGQFSGNSAFAWTGGSVVWNASSGYQQWGDNFNYYTALHEILHTLGMTHSSDAFKGLKISEETAEVTNMSYHAQGNNEGWINPAQLRIYDLAYLHYRFGVNKTVRSEDNVYTFKDADVFARDFGKYIYDGDGIDTFDASAETRGVTVDLTPGSWIHSGAKTTNFAISNQRKDYASDRYDEGGFYNVLTLNEYTQGQAFIGYGTQIENLIGSAHNDTLTGNNANNNIYGGAGSDTINGGLGDDYLDGGLGEDTMSGGEGDDTYVVDNANDKITELANQGTSDTVISSINYTLGDNVENLILVGINANQATGNALNNTLYANNIGNTLDGGEGDDRLVGGLGVDTLKGGVGNDTFVFNTALNGNVDIIADFSAGDIIELSANIFRSLVPSDSSNVLEFIKYNQDTGVLSYDSDGSGKVDAIDFANIGTGFTLDTSNFVIV